MYLWLQVYLLFCTVNPYPSRLHNVMKRMVSGEVPFLVQGDILSINTEATYRVWLSRILEFGDDTNANQWWKELDQLVPDVFVKVKEERRDAEYRERLNEAVVELLGHYLEKEPELAQADADAGDALDMDE